MGRGFLLAVLSFLPPESISVGSDERFDTHVPPTTGEVKFEGEPVKGPGPDRGMLFQDYGCYPHLSVLKNIGFGLNLHRNVLKLGDKDILEISMEWLKRVKLSEDDRHKFPHDLSGGMRQRVALARSLALKPECLLMDEPFSALDPIATQKIEELIHELRRNYTIIIVTHSMQQAARVSDRTAFFYMGRLIETGDTDQIFTRPANKQTEDYITGRFG